MIDEEVLRERIFDRLQIRVQESGGFLTRDELSAFEMGDGTHRRLIDTSKGIWNPRDLVATLSIVSSPDGPYDDQELSGGLVRYDYRAGSTGGDNTKLRLAGELGIPWSGSGSIDRVPISRSFPSMWSRTTFDTDSSWSPSMTPPG